MAKSAKFGVFGGVFTPSVLTILGVIMYMRLPEIVGRGGLWATLGIIIAAHVISVTTGLSVSSIATDKKVEAGGPYYIVSRSLGLPIGGTLGLALYVGLSFSISLYVIGFCESLLPYLGYSPRDTDAIRVAGAITLAGVTIVTLVSTSFAIKVQYVIMAAIVLSLVAILWGGSGEAPTEPILLPADDSVSIAALFALFFPAVTGFTAGVNMSGDLKDPRTAIPRGTLAAIAVGLFTYVGLAVFLAFTIDRTSLGRADVLLTNSLSEWLVVGGIWGATLSSAIGSILGAPRILQAKSQDRLTPEVFGRGKGVNNEPRNALVLTFAIAMGGILIGELEVIANIVSMFFIVTYGFLNISCAFESWTSPDFRPSFRIPIWVSVLGAITCVAIMIFLNPLAMIASAALLIGIFMYFKQRQLSLDSGDAWDGVWTSVVRSGLRRLTGSDSHYRNWRPNVLLFSARGATSRPALLQFTTRLMSGRGLVTDVELIDASDRRGAAPNKVSDDEDSNAFFHRPIQTDDAYGTMTGLAHYYGFNGLDPNTVMMDWNEHQRAPDTFPTVLDQIHDRDMNLIVVAHDARRDFGERQSIDVWLTGRGANLSLMLALVRFISAAPEWRRCTIRFLIASADNAQAARLKQGLQRVLSDNRIDAGVSAFLVGENVGAIEERIRQESDKADLVIIGLPDRVTDGGRAFVDRTEALAQSVGSVLLVRSSASFERDFRASSGYAGAHTGRRTSDRITVPTEVADVQPLSLPDVGILADETRRVSEGIERALHRARERCVTPLYEQQHVLLEKLQSVVNGAVSQLRKATTIQPVARQKKAVARAQSTLLFQSRELLSAFASDDLPQQRDLFAAGLESVKKTLDDITLHSPEKILVERHPADFIAGADDTLVVQRFKKRHRLLATLRRKSPSYTVRSTALLPYYQFERTYVAVNDALTGFAGDSYRVIQEYSSLVLELVEAFAAVDIAETDDIALEHEIAAVSERAETEFERIAQALNASLVEHQRALYVAGRAISQDFSDDLGRMDVMHHARKERRLTRVGRALAEGFGQVANAWDENLRLLSKRAELELQLAGYERRLGAVVDRSQTQVAVALKSGMVTPYSALLADLQVYRDAITEGQVAPFSTDHNFELTFRPKPLLDTFARETETGIDELPETIVIAPNDVTELSTQPFEPVTPLVLPVQRRVEFLVESEMIGTFQEHLSNIPNLEARANRVGQDVVRLVSYSINELIAGGASVDEVQTQLLPLLDDGIARVTAERDALVALLPDAAEMASTQLAKFHDRADIFTLSGTALRPRATSGGLWQAIGDGFKQTGAALRKAVVGLLYRRSVGVLLARRLKGSITARDTLVARLRAFVNQRTPVPSLMAALPFYYRQLFLGRSTSDTAFWVGRERELAAAAEAVANHKEGVSGALIVTGEASSGTTALAQVIARQNRDANSVYRILPPAGGAIEVAEFERAIGESLGLGGGAAEALKTLSEEVVLVFEDVELWWERSPDGLDVIDHLIGLIDQYSDRILFVLDMDIAAFRAVNRFRGLTDRALAVIECGPVDAKTLRKIIELRHGSTGLTFVLKDRTEAELSEWRRARLFSAHFDASRGLIGAALAGWLGHITAVEDERLVIRMPRAIDSELLADLDVDKRALLVQLALHRSLTVSRLLRLSGLGAVTLEAQMAMLERSGFIYRDGQGVVAINRYIRHEVIRHLEQRGVLP